MAFRSRASSVAVVGHICLDIIPSFPAGRGRLEITPGKLLAVGGATISTGGAVSNTGLALSRLGMDVKLVGKLGDDLLADPVRRIVAQYGENISAGLKSVAGEQTSYTVVLNPPGVDRTFLHCPGANDTFCAADVDFSQLTGVRLMHFGYPPLMRKIYMNDGAELKKIFSAARKRGMTVSLDLAQPDPQSPAGKVNWRKFLKNVLPHVDIFLPSVDELLFMMDRKLLAAVCSGKTLLTIPLLTKIADELLAMGPAMIGMKLGENGFFLRASADSRRLAKMGACSPVFPQAWAGAAALAPCFRVKVAGTTGSGDCTIAGFLAAVLKGMSPADCANFATAVGAFSVEQPDATSGVAPATTVSRRIAAGWKRLPVKMNVTPLRLDRRSGLYIK